MRKCFSLIFVLLVSYILCGCCSSCRISGSKQVTTLLSSRWQLDELLGEPLQMTNNDRFIIEFDKKKGSAFGKADCNKYFSSFALLGKSNISFSTIGATKMRCEFDEYESKYFRMLGMVNGFLINDDELMLLDNGSVIAVFQQIEKEINLK